MMGTWKLLITMMLTSFPVFPVSAQSHGADPLDVPLRRENGRLFVTARAANGAELALYLSTGTPMTVLSASAAARARNLTGIAFGGIPLSADEIQTVPDADLTFDGKTFDGIIGSNTLNQFNILVDVPAGRLRLVSAHTPVKWDGVQLSEPVRLRVYHGVVLGLDVAFGDNRYNAALDLGLPTLVVNERVKSETRIKNDDVGTLQLGSTTFAQLPVRVRDTGTLRRWAPNGEPFVLVGAPIAFDCAIAISFVHRELRTCVR